MWITEEVFEIENLLWIILIPVAAVVGLLFGYIIRKNVGMKTIGNAEQTAKNLILDAEKRAESIKKEQVLEAKDEALKIKRETDEEIKQRRLEISKSERKLIEKEEKIDRKTEEIEKRSENLARKEQTIAQKEAELDEVIGRQNVELEKISGYTKEEAKQILLSNVEKDVRQETAILIRDLEQEARDTADAKAREIITGAVQRCAADHVAEITVSVVPLPSDDMKGRIIGREG
ncbi:MAG: Rnase Y domain-containing protein, partial [Clostridiales Family XIII bacterium]|nr:Rnase Y domain-containing protein [Clostridiales Family XIII bacterium]